jgi:hypothetical protein
MKGKLLADIKLVQRLFVDESELSVWWLCTGREHGSLKLLPVMRGGQKTVQRSIFRTVIHNSTSYK